MVVERHVVPKFPIILELGCNLVTVKATARDLLYFPSHRISEPSCPVGGGGVTMEDTNLIGMFHYRILYWFTGILRTKNQASQSYINAPRTAQATEGGCRDRFLGLPSYQELFKTPLNSFAICLVSLRDHCENPPPHQRYFNFTRIAQSCPGTLQRQPFYRQMAHHLDIFEQYKGINWVKYYIKLWKHCGKWWNSNLRALMEFGFCLEISTHIFGWTFIYLFIWWIRVHPYVHGTICNKYWVYKMTSKTHV